MQEKKFEEIVIEKQENYLCNEHKICLKVIRDNVIKMWNNSKEIPLPYYTTHGPEHCYAVEQLIFKLIPSFMKLEEEERFYLLASAWLHDIGMLRSVANELNTDKSQEESDNSEIREIHHNTSEKFIIEHYNKCGLEHKIYNSDHTEDKQLIGKICRYHRRREDIDTCPETIPIRNEKYRVQLLAAYLRLADALHIDSSRAPDYAYAICLAYDIPSEIKMHWIKSKLVLGITIDEENHRITVSFRIPTLEQLKERNLIDTTKIMEKIDYIIKEVIDDLRKELASVMHILAMGGLSYYLDIRAEKVTGYIERQLLNDLLSMVINYDILSNPSASNLIEMVLMSIANISGYYLKEEIVPKQVSIISGKVVKNELTNFLDQLQNNLLNKRNCHYGLKKLIHECQALGQKHLPGYKGEFIKEINTLYQNHFIRKKNIRASSRAFCRDITDGIADISKVKFQVLLYGYSNLVVQALCGFRDSLIRKLYNFDTDTNFNIYNSEFKKDFSKNHFEIFVCDGQPKTQLNLAKGVLYHDGSSLVNELIKSDFTDVVLIPDIIAGNVIEDLEIDFIMMGANGFNGNKFRHSAGHRSIIKFNEYLKYIDKEEKRRTPLLILVVTSDKYNCETDQKKNQRNFEFDKHNNEVIDYSVKEKYGFRFRESKEILTRDNIWFLNDDEISTIKESLLFYNPREDSIPLDHVDFVISDIGNFQKENIQEGVVGYKCSYDSITRGFINKLDAEVREGEYENRIEKSVEELSTKKEEKHKNISAK